MIGGDFNASVGTRREESNKSLGPWGIEDHNERGDRLLQFLETNKLLVTSSFFNHKNYVTHVSNLKHVSPRQLDYWFVRKTDFKMVTDCRIRKAFVDTDHDGIELKIRMPGKIRVLKRRTTRPHVDRELLEDPEIRLNYQQSVRRHIAARKNYDEPLYTTLSFAMSAASEEHCMTTSRKNPGWYTVSEKELDEAIHKRNLANATVSTCRTLLRQATTDSQKATRRYNLARAKSRRTAMRSKLKKSIKRAKMRWVEMRVEVANKEIVGACARDAWRAVREIEKGWGIGREDSALHLRKNDNTLCISNEENAEVFAEHFTELYNIPSTFDFTVLEEMEQLEVDTEMRLGETPGPGEISKATKRLNNNKAPGLNGLTAEHFKAIVDDDEIFGLLCEVVTRYWEGAQVPYQFAVGRLSIIPKGGDLTDRNKWRGITLLDVASKIVSKIVADRLARLLAKVGIEEQVGFQQDRGSQDGNFVIRQALKIRRESGLDSFALFVDLVKAFDSVPRDGLFAVLRKFGVPEDLMTVIQNLHKNCSVLFSIGKEIREIPSTTGVKQGDVLAPILFLFFIQAAVTTMTNAPEWTFERCRFNCSHRDQPPDLNNGRRTVKEGDETFEMIMSLYADDAAFIFTTRDDLVNATTFINSHLKRFGLTMHVAPKGSTKSKTEAMFVPGHGRDERVPLCLESNYPIEAGTVIYASRTENLPRQRVERTIKSPNDTHAWLSPVLWDETSESFTFGPKRLTRSKLEEYKRDWQILNKQGQYIDNTYEAIKELTQPFEVDSIGSTVSFCDKFKYLGSLCETTMGGKRGDIADIRARRNSSFGIFASLGPTVFTAKDMNKKVKKKAYEALVLAVMLYGCETWCVNSQTSEEFKCLRSLHRSFCRRMARFRMQSHRTLHIHSREIMQRLGIYSIDTYVYDRAFLAHGRRCRQHGDRLSRKMMSAYIPDPRMEKDMERRRWRGASFGKSLQKQLCIRLKNPSARLNAKGEPVDTYGVIGNINEVYKATQDPIVWTELVKQRVLYADSPWL